VIQVWDGVVIAPLIGILDSQRTQNFMERFLGGIVETGSQVALLDITGVPNVDTQTGQHLIEAITAAKLLGTQVILTGVRPLIAQTLVHLGIDLSDFETCSSLKSGLKAAFNTLGFQISQKKQ
jgi:anti-anti-sigma regulatory factor